MEFDIEYQLREAKLNQENCRWLSGENIDGSNPFKDFF